MLAPKRQGILLPIVVIHDLAIFFRIIKPNMLINKNAKCKVASVISKYNQNEIQVEHTILINCDFAVVVKPN